jgi:hypothetical protein
VTVTDMLPPSVSYVSATPTQGTCSEAAGTVTCNLGDVADGDFAQITIKVIPAVSGVIVNQASVDAAQDDPDPSDNSATAETTVQAATGGYPRPKGATPMRLSLVPAFNQCTVPNRVHGAPLAFPACSPPVQASGALTIGTPETNGRVANSIGSIRMDVFAGDTSTVADEADLGLQLSITDVRRKSDLADYTGEMQGSATLRITDRNNAVAAGGGSDAATIVDIPFPVPVGCAATSDAGIGGLCTTNTSFDALIPGTVKEGKRAIWAIGQFSVTDGGPDGQNATTPNTLFARQGVFVP